MKTRLWITAILFPMVNAVLFGVGIIALLSIPALSGKVDLLFTPVVIASFVIAAPLSWFIAPRLRARYWRRRQMREGLTTI